MFVGCDVAGLSTNAKKADQWRDVTSAGCGGSVVVPYQLSDVGRKAETSLVRPTLGCGSQGRIKQHIGRFGHVETIVDMHNTRNIYEPGLYVRYAPSELRAAGLGLPVIWLARVATCPAFIRVSRHHVAAKSPPDPQRLDGPTR